jgi:hypothetical protein
MVMVTLERPSPLLTLKRTLVTDAAISGAVGVLSLAGAAWLDSVLDLPTALLAASGGIMVVYALGLLLLAMREPIPAAGGRAVVAGNLLWAAACIVLLFGGWIDPNALGVAFVIVQVVAVLAFAELQAMALRTVREA